MTKQSKKVTQNVKSAPVSRKSLPKRWILIAAVALVAIGIAVWKFWPGNEEVYQIGKMHGVEETLTAKSPLLQLLEPDETGIDFQNQIVETKANNFATNINIYNGGGVAVGDFNNDNLPDIYFICTNGQNRLYQNQGNFKFKDVTQAAGLTSEEGFETAAAAIDINADGFLDLYVCRAGPFENDERRNKLYINNGNMTFTEKAKEYGLDDMSASTGANFFDGDGDGDLDLYLLNYPKDMAFANKIESKQGPDGNMIANLSPKDPLDSDRFYRNDGGKFTDISQQSGIWNRGFGLSVSVGDLNRDGAPDVYVANDFLQPDRLYINNGKGVFSDELNKRIRHNTQFSMGTDISDFDNDGLIDIYAVDMMPANNYRHKTLKISNTNSLYLSLVQNGILEPVTHNVLQRNNGNGTFSDVACQAGVFRTDWSWSNLVADYDNDGMRDIYVSNGYRREIHHIDHADFMKDMKKNKSAQQILQEFKTLDDYLNSVPSYKIRDFIFQNKGNWKFEDKSGDWATMKATWSCGAAWTDLDLDGDLDLVVNNLEDPAFVFKNQAREQNKGNYIQAKLKGSPQNPFAVGASVLIEYGNGQKQYQEISPNRGIFSCSEHLIHFGLGQESQIAKLSVRWPDGKTQMITNVPTNQRLQLDYTNASGYVATLVPDQGAQTLMAETGNSGVNFVHKESKFNDFENYPLMVWMESELGPLTAQADVNGDGLEDFFVGNAFNAPAALFLQNSDGSFKASNQALWEAEKAYEDHGAVFFDFDGDQDQDLFVVSGGFDAPAQGRDKLWQNRLYLNDGKGNFSKANGAVPSTVGDIGLRVVAHDYDNDGDADLFVGGRLVPDKWPLTPRSLILRNDRNKLTDVTEEVGGDFARCGMVTDLAWADLDKDGQAELVAVGEWMPVSVFKLNGGKLSNVTEQMGLGQSNGLWCSLQLADVDQDGDSDLITGNFGINTRFTTSPDAPFSCYAKDFDNNGTLDPIVTLYEGKKNFPLVQKEVMVKQMPSLKKKYLYAINYSQTTIEEMWGSGLKDALKLVANDMETCWWENQGGKFVRHSLPYQAQASAIQGIVAEDLNGDGHLDLLMAGNKYGMEVGTGRYDAGNGVFLAGDGKGNFRWVNNLESGFWAMRDARDVAVIKGAGGKRSFVVANNNSGLQVYK
ncbi:MAG TPA: VCBS repeat-containing protein [Saprospiraceae bacterium]|nr:VCBS repeat-containing protein [Saprospiraceae bacterium]